MAETTIGAMGGARNLKLGGQRGERARAQGCKGNLCECERIKCLHYSVQSVCASKTRNVV